VAATDYVRAYPELIAAHLDARLVALGTDGFGRSDTRARLRQFFEVDRYHIVVTALHTMAEEGRVPAEAVTRALDQYSIDVDSAPPWSR
jgi:pyruvate dehydrogenase E1 component